MPKPDTRERAVIRRRDNAIEDANCEATKKTRRALERLVDCQSDKEDLIAENSFLLNKLALDSEVIDSLQQENERLRSYVCPKANWQVVKKPDRL